MVQQCHVAYGHYGLEKTLRRITKDYWFPKMRAYVKKYIYSCIDCCYHPTGGRKEEGRLHFSDPEPIPFRLLHIDHLGPFVRSNRGNCYVLAISDAFTKFLVVNALNELTSFFGLPRQIVTDRGTSFTSKMFSSYCDANYIAHVKTAVRTPRANGQVERANQSILRYLRTCHDSPKDLDLFLRNLQYTINSQVNSTSGFSPNDLIFDFKLVDVVQNGLIAAIHNDIKQSNDGINMTERPVIIFGKNENVGGSVSI